MEQVKKDYTKEVKYASNHLDSFCEALNTATRHITKRWQEHNIDNIFSIKPKAIYYNQAIRISITIESEIGNNNILFYSRQGSISVLIVDNKTEFKKAIQDFVWSVMGDLMEQGIESFRRKTISDQRNRMYVDLKKSIPGSEYMVRPFSPEESYDANIAEDDVVDYKEV